MTPKPPVALSKDQVLVLFPQLAQRRKAESRVVTREEEARKARDREAAEAAAAHTVEGIVKGLAGLQLDFGKSVDELAARLEAEARKLGELQGAIEIVGREADRVSDIKVAADALHVLRLEHRQQVLALEERGAKQRAELADEAARARAAWAKEAELSLALRKDAEGRALRERERAEADYVYQFGRARALEDDAFEERRRKVERELAQAQAQGEKRWGERERLLAEGRAEYEANARRLESLPQELDEAVKKAREEGIREASHEAEVRAELFGKEVEASHKVFALKIQALEQVAQRQLEQIESLTGQLHVALREGQELALKAIEGSTGRGQPRG
ncbi:MAG TPA: hypothetical protein VFS43_36105 [Polyangiaceae bacterium]|nr:hypothetical protein [Polyangiaceae bacterium]